MSKKVKGCVWCDRLRKGSRTVKPSRNPRVHWVTIVDGSGYNGFQQVPCQKFREEKP